MTEGSVLSRSGSRRHLKVGCAPGKWGFILDDKRKTLDRKQKEGAPIVVGREANKGYIQDPLGFPGGSVVKNPPAMQDMWVRSLGQEDPLEKEMASPSSVLAWKIPWIEEPGGLQSMGSQKNQSDMT